MPAISFNADLKIRVVFPTLTKSLPTSDRNKLGQTGTFKYEPRPQVETAQASNTETNFTASTPQKDRFNKLGEDLDDLIAEAERIEKVYRERSQGIVFEYDPANAQNEALATAEREIFGSASGRITYTMFEQILNLEEKINKWISHQSIINDGQLNGVA
jgi:hypothetical protein